MSLHSDLRPRLNAAQRNQPDIYSTRIVPWAQDRHRMILAVTKNHDCLDSHRHDKRQVIRSPDTERSCGIHCHRQHHQHRRKQRRQHRPANTSTNSHPTTNTILSTLHRPPPTPHQYPTSTATNITRTPTTTTPPTPTPTPTPNTNSDERRTTNDERRTTNDERRTTNDEQQMTNDAHTLTHSHTSSSSSPSCSLL